MAEINVTPLVDVMLVLLIIFMVTAPMMTSGLDLKLPEAQAPQIESSENKLMLSINAKQQLMLGDKPIKLSEIPTSLKNAKEIQLHADKSLPYGFVVKVMGVLKSHGVDNISLVTEAGGDSLD